MPHQIRQRLQTGQQPKPAISPKRKFSESEPHHPLCEKAEK